MSKRQFSCLTTENTIPFITRFRKDLTGGLNEKQISVIKQQVAQLRALSERKNFILKSIESQGKLTDELRTNINRCHSSRRLEDLYLPFKPKKQTKAATAKQQGLEPLAEDIFTATTPDVDLATRATEFVHVDKGLKSVDDVIRGVGDLLVERFSENGELRSSLRQVLWNTGKLVTQSTEQTQSVQPSSEPISEEPKKGEGAKAESVKSEGDKNAVSKTETKSAKIEKQESETAANETAAQLKPVAGVTEAKEVAEGIDNTSQAAGQTPTALSPVPTSAVPTSAVPTSAVPTSAVPTSAVPTATDSTEPESGTTEPKSNTTEPVSTDSDSAAPTNTDVAQPQPATPLATEETGAVSSEANVSIGENAPKKTDEVAKPTEPTAAASPAEKVVPAAPASEDSTTAKPSVPEAATGDAPAKPAKKRKKKKKKKKPVNDPFKDFHDFKHPLKNLPNHRVLAINRGERAGKLKVKVEADTAKMLKLAVAASVPENHPFTEFLQKCVGEALSKVLVPSLEREIRRELTEAAERHAVDVFASNLRNLLLQPPIRNRFVLAIDPGFKRGCSVAILDPLGNLLDSGHVFVVGNQTRRDESKQRLVNWITKHSIDVVSIGTGAACRQAEQLVSDTISEHLQDHKVRYVMVNEAGASIYSTSEIGREELPDLTPAIRSAVSIGRRLQDPLSELVKISPANIGVGMYQHDVKAKHLSESLDEVVQFCVNQVGVNVNTASPSLLKYVAGMNALTARRVVEYRQQINGFKNRQQLKEVNGVGDATFVQAAGFLRIRGGDCPLDSTSVHPESYPIAESIIAKVNTTASELFPTKPDVIPKPVVAKKPEVKQPFGAMPVEVKDPAPATSSTDAPSSEASGESLPTVDSANPVTETPATNAIDASAENPEPSEPVSPAPISPAPTTAEPVAAETPSPEIPSPESATTEAASTETPTPESPVPSTAEPEKPTEVASVVATPTEEDVAAIAKRKQIIDDIMKLEVEEIANQNSAGKMLVRDILMTLRKPDWDPRDRIQQPIFRRGIIKVDDLKPEMQLEGQIVNVVDFGVFVDIGLGESSLVHVSQLSNQYVRDPHRFCAVGDVLHVWVSEIDVERRRVKLTAIRPGSKAPTGRPRGGGRSATKSTQRSGQAGGKSPGKYHGKKPDSRGGGSDRASSFRSKQAARKRPPKPVKPITDKMLKGDEPMRSFSDLAQFVKKKPDDPDNNESTDK